MFSATTPSRVYLRPTRASDLEFVISAERDSENALFIGQWPRDRHLAACSNPDERHWIVIASATQQPVGYLIMTGVANPDQSLLIKRIVITQKGCGLGPAALTKAVSIAFLELHAHRVWLDVVENNHRAMAIYRKLGFVEEGRLRECFRTPEGFLSMRIFSILHSEFLAQRALAE